MKRHRLIALLILLFSVSSLCYAEGNYLNSIKFTFLSWATGSTKISYERAIPEFRQSAEICAGLISAGYDKYQNNPVGFTVRYGHKFFVGNYTEEKPFDGFFIRPEIIYTQFRYTSKETSERTMSKMGSLLGTFGYQKTFDRFIIDSWIGAGLAIGTPADTGYQHGFKAWDINKSNIESIALSFSIRLGWVF